MRNLARTSHVNGEVECGRQVKEERWWEYEGVGSFVLYKLITTGSWVEPAVMATATLATCSRTGGDYDPSPPVRFEHMVKLYSVFCSSVKHPMGP